MFVRNIDIKTLKTVTYVEKASGILEIEKQLKIKSFIAKKLDIPFNTLSPYLKNKGNI